MNLNKKREYEEQNDTKFNNYFEKYYISIGKYINKYTKNHQVSEELTQNVFLKLFKKFSNLKEDNLKGWLYKVAHNETIDYLKKNSNTEISIDYTEPFTNNTPEKAIEDKINRETIELVLLSLPKNQRTAIVLKDVKGYSYEQIATTMGISYGAVKSLIYRGRQNFIKYYKEENNEEL